MEKSKDTASPALRLSSSSHLSTNHSSAEPSLSFPAATGLTWYEDSVHGIVIPTSNYSDCLKEEDQEALNKIELKPSNIVKSGLLVPNNSHHIEKLVPGTQFYHAGSLCYGKLEKLVLKPHSASEIDTVGFEPHWEC